MSDLQVCSPTLRRELISAAEIFKNYEAKVNAATAEIRALENYLRNKGVAIPTWIDCFEDPFSDDEFIHQYSIGWDYASTRLMYVLRYIDTDAKGKRVTVDGPAESKPL